MGRRMRIMRARYEPRVLHTMVVEAKPKVIEKVAPKKTRKPKVVTSSPED